MWIIVYLHPNEVNTFHGMGIIATLTPNLNPRSLVPKMILSTEYLIIQIGKTETRISESKIQKLPIQY